MASIYRHALLLQVLTGGELSVRRLRRMLGPRLNLERMVGLLD